MFLTITANANCVMIRLIVTPTLAFCQKNLVRVLSGYAVVRLCYDMKQQFNTPLCTYSSHIPFDYFRRGYTH